jgi:hypothetical protein
VINMQSRQIWSLLGGAVLLATAGGGWWLAMQVADASSSTEAEPGGHGVADLILQALPGDFLRPIQHSGQAMGEATRTPDQLREALMKGALRGTTPLGSWCVVGEMLRPCPTLRARFEYYLHALGEISPPEARVLIEDEAQRAVGRVLAGQIMTIYDRYWSARNHEFQHPLDPADHANRTPAMQERQQVRERLLGAEWARAFFAQDEP